MRILITSLLLLAGLNLILARSFWNPNNDYYDYDLFKMPSNLYNNEYNDFIMPSASDDNVNVADEHDTVVHFLNGLLGTNPFNVGHVNLQKSEENMDNNDSEHEQSVKEEADDDDKHEENDNSVVLLFLVKDDDDESDEVTPITENTEAEIVDLTKSSEEKIEDDQDKFTITEKDIKELTEFLVVLNAIDELLKISIDDLNKTYDDDEYSSKEKELKGFDDFLKSIIDSIEEDEQITHENREDTSDDDVTTTSISYSSDEDDTTTPKNNSSEEDDVTTPKTDSIEDEDNNGDSEGKDDTITNNSNEFAILSLILHGTDDAGQNESIDNHKYEIVDTFKPTSPPYMPDVVPYFSSNINDQNIVKQYIEIREDLDTEQDKLKINKLNLDKDFYNIISSNYNEEGMKKFENDVNVLQENFDRIKRHINGMENLNSKLYFQKLIKAAVKDIKNKSKDLMSNI